MYAYIFMCMYVFKTEGVNGTDAKLGNVVSTSFSIP